MKKSTQAISTKTNNHPPQKNIVVQEIESYNAPPLDFSYKNVKDLQELKQLEPRQVLQQVKQGKKYVIEQKAAPRKPIVVEVEAKEEPKGNVDDKDKAEAKEQQNTEEKKEDGEDIAKVPEILRLIPNSNVNNFVAQVPLYSAANKASSSHAKDEEAGQVSKKVVKVKQIQSQLILSYNKIASVASLPEVLPSVMLDGFKLQWIDLSHNYLIDLDLDFSLLPDLSSLYLHCNYIKDLNQFVNLSRNALRSLTVHGNPIETIPNFRLYLISILLQLKKLDTVLISKKERDDSNVFLVKFNMRSKAFPEVKDAQQPPKEEEAEPAQNKN